MLKPTCRPELLIWGFGITLKAVLCRCAQQRLRVNVEKKRWMGCWLLLFSYLQCWCVWYSRPPQPEFPAAVCGSLGYRRPYGSAAGCGDLDLWISRCGQRLLRHHHHHRPSSSFLSGAVDKIALFPRLSHTLTAPSSPHSRAPWYERQVWGGSKRSQNDKHQDQGFLFPLLVWLVPHGAKYKNSIEWNALF